MTQQTSYNTGKGAGETVGVALLGFGTVGQAAYRLMNEYADEFTERAGGPIEIRGRGSHRRH